MSGAKGPGESVGQMEIIEKRNDDRNFINAQEAAIVSTDKTLKTTNCV